MTFTDAELALLVAGIALGGVVFGAIVAGVFSLVSGAVENRRQSARWHRDELYRFLVDISTSTSLVVAAKKGGSHRDDEAARIAESQAKLGLLADQGLLLATANLTAHAQHALDPKMPAPEEAFAITQRAFFDEGRRALHLPKF